MLKRSPKKIDGVNEMLEKLSKEGVMWKILTNGGGDTEENKAKQFSKVLDYNIPPQNLVLSHTPMVNCFF